MFSRRVRHSTSVNLEIFNIVNGILTLYECMPRYKLIQLLVICFEYCRLLDVYEMKCYTQTVSVSEH